MASMCVWLTAHCCTHEKETKTQTSRLSFLFGASTHFLRTGGTLEDALSKCLQQLLRYERFHEQTHGRQMSTKDQLKASQSLLTRALEEEEERV
jgi:hypothetical protein